VFETFVRNQQLGLIELNGETYEAQTSAAVSYDFFIEDNLVHLDIKDYELYDMELQSKTRTLYEDHLSSSDHRILKEKFDPYSLREFLFNKHEIPIDKRA